MAMSVSQISRSFLLILSIIFTSGAACFAQLDSAEVNVFMSIEASSLDSLVSVDVLNVETTMSDFTDLGEIVISVSHTNENSEQAVCITSKQDYIDSGNVSGNTVVNKFYYIDPNSSYTIKTTLRRSDGASLSMIETSLIN